MGTRDANAKSTKVNPIAAGASANWPATGVPVDSSANTAATKPTMARRPLVISGAAPLKAMASGKLKAARLNTICQNRFVHQ